MAIRTEKPMIAADASLEEIIDSLKDQSSEGVVNPVLKAEDFETIKKLGDTCIDVLKEKGVSVTPRTHGEYWVVGQILTEGVQDG